jgi:hypothetical protein
MYIVWFPLKVEVGGEKDGGCVYTQYTCLHTYAALSPQGRHIHLHLPMLFISHQGNVCF